MASRLIRARGHLTVLSSCGEPFRFFTMPDKAKFRRIRAVISCQAGEQGLSHTEAAQSACPTLSQQDHEL